MKSMNRKENKKIAVMAAVIVGFMMFAFMPLASANGGVTGFTVTPTTGIAGAVDSYNAIVTTTGVTTIEISIPAGFIAVTPTKGGVLIAEVNFWNSSTKAYYGSATITASDTYPTEKVDVVCELGGETATKTQLVKYAPGTTTTFESGFACDKSSATIKLPTVTEDGSITITIDCSECPGFSDTWRLDDVQISIGQFVRNPLTAGKYDFFADGKKATVSITTTGGRGIVYDNANAKWSVDTTGDHWIDDEFLFGPEGAIPLIGNFGSEDTAAVKAYGGNYRWEVDTTGNHEADEEFWFGFEGAIPLVGDINQDGTDDIAIVKAYGGNYRWFVNTSGGPREGILEADMEFWYGFEGSIPLVGNINQIGEDDIAIVNAYGGNYRWFVDTDGANGGYMADEEFWYGFADAIPLVGDIDWDGTDDIAIVNAYGGNYRWFVDTNFDKAADQEYWFRFEDAIPLAGDIG